MDSRRTALRSFFRSGRLAAMWSRISRSAEGLEKSAAAMGACSTSQSCSTFSARSMVGQIGHRVSSRSREMALILAISSIMPFDGKTIVNVRATFSENTSCLPPISAHGRAPQTAVLYCNLGTPDEPTPAAVRRYLAEFLSDPRVVEIPRARMAAPAVRTDPAAALGQVGGQVRNHLDAGRLAAEVVDRQAGQAAARLAG